MASSRAGRLVDCGLRKFLRRDSVFFLFLVSAFGVRALGDATDTSKAEAERLIAAAAQAESRGDIPKSLALLNEARSMDPQNRLARWRLGELQINKKWMTVEESQRRAAADRRQIEYQDRRASAGNRRDAQIELAKWCGKNYLLDEARYHWTKVLAAESENRDALKALGMRKHNGRLITAAEYHDVTSGASARRRHQVIGSMAKWRNAFAGKIDMPVDDALTEIRSIRSVEAIPLIEEWVGLPPLWVNREPQKPSFDRLETEYGHVVSREFAAALAKMPEQPATESLVRFAVASPFEEVRNRTTEELQKRPLYDYAALLLDMLTMPAESSYEVKSDSDGIVRYVHKVYRPGADADRSEIHKYEHELAPPPGFGADGSPFALGFNLQLSRRKDGAFTCQEALYKMRASQFEGRLSLENQENAARNKRVIIVLAATTGQDLGNDPRKWWSSWQKQNEYYVPETQPVYEQQYDKKEKYWISCFVKGTPVWTRTGQKPIESLKAGDLVLSQNVNTGELKYQPVVERTVRPPSEILTVTIDGEGLGATRGHPFWIAGVGWRMAKELGDGAVLCGINKAAQVKSIQPAEKAEAFNLVVAEFSTYFVGKHGLLVHDNARRRPSQSIVPGVRRGK